MLPGDTGQHSPYWRVFNLAARRINASTGVTSRTATRLALADVGDAPGYADATLALPSAGAKDRYADATQVLDDINTGRALRS